MIESDVIQAQGQAMWTAIQALFITSPEMAAFQVKVMEEISKALEGAYEQALLDQKALDAVPADGGVSPAQEAADIAVAIAAAVKPLNDQIAALQLAKESEDALLASVQVAAKSLAALFPN